MNDARQSLFGDPLYQLNVVLWALWDAASPPITAALKIRDYSLAAIGSAVAPGQDIGDLYYAWFKNRSPAEPDVIAESAVGPTLLIECKSRSFGIDSSTAVQARKFFACSAPVRSYYGRKEYGATLVYVVGPTSPIPEFCDCLETIRADVAKECEASEFFVYVIGETPDGVGFLPQAGSANHGLPDKLLSPMTVIESDQDDLPIPPYLIIYDPSLNYDNDPPRRLRAQQELVEAVAVGFAGDVGRAAIGSRIFLDTRAQLERVTYGLLPYWRNATAVDALKGLVARHIEKRVNSVKNAPAIQRTRDGIDFRIESREQQSHLLNALQVELTATEREVDFVQEQLPLTYD